MLWFDSTIFTLTLVQTVRMRRYFPGGILERLLRDGQPLSCLRMNETLISASDNQGQFTLGECSRCPLKSCHKPSRLLSQNYGGIKCVKYCHLFGMFTSFASAAKYDVFIPILHPGFSCTTYFDMENCGSPNLFTYFH